MGNNFLISCVNKNEKNVAQQKLTSLQVLQSLNGKKHKGHWILCKTGIRAKQTELPRGKGGDET